MSRDTTNPLASLMGRFRRERGILVPKQTNEDKREVRREIFTRLQSGSQPHQTRTKTEARTNFTRVAATKRASIRRRRKKAAVKSQRRNRAAH